MRVAPVFVLAFLLPFAMARAEDREMRPRFFEISRAAVLASPGTPSAMHSFLPRGEAPTRLTWPLPAGPVLVLGLPESDPVAREIADALGMEVGKDILGGGYCVDAWRDGKRTLVFVFASDAAALYGARFEFDASAPAELIDPDARSLDFKRPNQEAGLIVRAGLRVVKPRYAMRALRPRSHVPHIGSLVAGARGNRAWLVDKKVDHRSVRQLRAQGVEPVLVGGPDNVERFERAQRVGVRHFALVIPRDFEGDEGKAVGDVAVALRPGGLAELTVVPRGYSDRLAETYPPPDLRSIPEAVIAWSGPEEHSVRITRADAERRVQEAGVPVVLYDTWAEPFDGHEAYLPVRPYGRDPDLCAVLDGLVAVGSRGTTPMLESAWAGIEEDPFGAHLLGPLLPAGGEDVEDFVTKSAMRIEKEVEDTQGLVGWMAPLAKRARAAALRIHKGERALGVPVVKSPVQIDGAIDEPAWGFARKVPVKEPATVLVLSDARRLYFAVRTAKDAELRFEIDVEEAGRRYHFHVRAGEAGIAAEGAHRHIGSGHGALGGSGGHLTAEFVLDRFALHGEAHPLRTFELRTESESVLLVVTR